MNRTSDVSTLLMLPGLLCSDYVWQPQVKALSRYNTIAVTGYGRARSFAAMAEQVLQQAPSRFALAGHSMGGRVALEVFRRAPERVERLALLDTGVHPVQPGEADKRIALLNLGKEQGIEALVDAWLPPMVHPDRRDDDAFMAPLRSMCIEAGLQQFEDQITALLDRPDATPLLGEIRVPTLVATGRDDAWSPPEQHQPIADAIENSTLVVYENCGHMSTVESPNAVSESLSDWMQSG